MTEKKTHYEVVIVGGGSAGISVAARLRNLEDPLDVAVIEPSEVHYYQPLWTLVGGGVMPKERTRKTTEEVMPLGAEWIKDRVSEFEPEKNEVRTESGAVYSYDYLVVAPGIQLDWDKIKGLKGNIGRNGICSNYSYETVDSTWKALREFKGGEAVFTYPQNPIKCGGAPQKIMWLSEHYLERQGIRDKATVHFASTTAAIFGVAKYRAALEKLVEKREIQTHFGHELVEVKADEKIAVFERTGEDGGKSTVELNFDMLHVTPPQSAPDFIKKSPLSNADGWVDVDHFTLQHNRYENVFSAGDAAALPTAKTGAAVRKQAPVLVENLLAVRRGEPMPKKYNGYSSCPLVTGYGRLILAEFDYDGNPVESFPFNQAQERYSMYALKVYALPEMYWHGMLKGRA